MQGFFKKKDNGSFFHFMGLCVFFQVACFTVPTIKDVFFSQFPLKKDSVKVISQGGIVEKRAQGFLFSPLVALSIVLIFDQTMVTLLCRVFRTIPLLCPI
jgi:hypothetical protein